MRADFVSCGSPSSRRRTHTHVGVLKQVYCVVGRLGKVMLVSLLRAAMILRRKRAAAWRPTAFLLLLFLLLLSSPLLVTASRGAVPYHISILSSALCFGFITSLSSLFLSILSSHSPSPRALLLLRSSAHSSPILLAYFKISVV